MLAVENGISDQHPANWRQFADHRNIHPIRSELFGLDHLEAHARKLGELLAQSRTIVEAGQPLPKMFSRNAEVLRSAHRSISEAYRDQEPLGHDAEWLLDNYHILSDAVAEIRTDLPPGYYDRLPKLTVGPLAGYPRVYAVALDLTAHCDSSLDESNITRFVQAVQTAAPLTVGELWAVPIMLRLCLIDNLRRLAEHIVHFRDHRRQAQDWIAGSLPTLAQRPQPAAFGLQNVQDDWRDCYAMHLLEGLHDHEAIHPDAVERFEKTLAESNDTPAGILLREKQRQAANQVSIGNCVTSLRVLSALDWAKFFEATSTLEATLRQDPAGIYASQDFATRDRYRRIVEELARGSKKTEAEVAAALLLRARRGGNETPGGRGHIGHYLVDEGRLDFETELGYRAPVEYWLQRLALKHPSLLYFGGLGVIIIALLAVLGWASVLLDSAGWLIALTLIVAVLPISELAVGLMNFLAVCWVPPRTLPRLALKDGVPQECATFIVIPSMLTSQATAAGLVERLEIHYLSNPERNVYFGLLTDFADAPAETMPTDDPNLRTASEGIRALNAKYCGGESPRFFLFHRRRQWNPGQNCWMGWERKRGKLAEFNRLLRQAADTSFSVISAGLEAVPRIRFVITLDTDTQLPRETARRMIATLAHPLNQPQFDLVRRRVVRGYGILQPRIGLSLRGARKSIFARIFTGSAGLDPYTTAVSDTYQDLFGSGSFTGKGIYDVDAFEASVGHAFPTNHILSHDLIEGNYARCGLITDVELLDDFPSHYLAFLRRENRWVRGDWQILPWLFGKVPGPGQTPIPNPLPLLERWKIADNLRRSLTPPALLLLLILGWTILPGSPWQWTGLAAIVLAWPLLLQILTLPFHLLRQATQGNGLRFPARDLGFTAGQVLLSAAFLIAHARSMMDAIGRTLYRMGISHRNLLDWESAAVTERRLDSGAPCFMRALWPDSFLALLAGISVGYVNIEAFLPASPFILGWLLSPWIAHAISQPRKALVAKVMPREEKDLRRLARKTWSFFETFVGADDHWLPPDNFQEDPKGEVAHRTSPTNIGLYLLSCIAAHDFGYLGLPGLVDRLEKTFATLGTMERSHGHFYNWYDTSTLQALHPVYLSTVDSGNFAACLVVVKQSLQEKLDVPILDNAVAAGMRDLLKLIEENLRAIKSPGHSGKLEIWAIMEPHLRALESLIQTTPAELTAWPAWLDRLSAEQLALEDAARRLGEEIDEPLPEFWRWLTNLADLLKVRRAELAGLTSSAGQHPELDQLTLARLASKQLAPASQRNGSTHSTATDHASWAEDLESRCLNLMKQAEAMAAGMDFKVLYNAERNLFAVGYNLSLGRLDNAHYDLLASESSLTSFLAIARGDVPRKHWFQLGRPVTRIGSNTVLLSWGGTMFEYLMPRLLLRMDPDTLLDETEHGAVDAQIEYGRQCRAPWGISESAYNTVDGQLNYQYQAFGAPSLGLKRGLSKDLVVAPYATGLAFMARPAEALANLHRLHKEGADGPYGWYEAIDYTAERLPKGRRSAVVKCFMAHHQGMTLLSLANCLLNNPMPRRFHAAPMIRATELLLQERVPSDAAPAELQPQEAAPVSAFHEIPPHMSRRITTPHTAHPRTHMLASSQYSVMVTNAGSGQSKCRDLAVTRWREDRTCDAYGQFFYLRDLRTGKRWSAGYQPLCQEPDQYEVTYAADKAEFRRVDGPLETRMEITIGPENHAEVRRLTITNHDDASHYLDLTSYVEIVLAPQSADLAHPAFGKLFLETEYLPEAEALLCRRRPRSPDEKPVWALHVLAADGRKFGAIQYETDRARFLGRGRTTADPAALDPGAALSGTTGPVLDPVLSLRRQFRVKAGASVQFAFITALADTHEKAVALADYYHDFHGVHRAFELAWAHTQVELRQLHVTAAETHLFQRLATHLFFAGTALRAAPAQVAANRQGQSDLWRQGISGDLPIVLVRIASAEELPLARQMIMAHSFWRLKGLSADLVILNDQQGGYFEDLHQQLQTLIRASEDRPLVDKPGGAFLRKASHLSREDLGLLLASARCVLVGSRGLLGIQLDRLERTLTPAEPRPKTKLAAMVKSTVPLSKPLQFDNGLGGFTEQGHEYVIRLTAQDGRYALPPQPWINVIANPSFGFLISESGGSFTWAGNSQANRLTPWHNDPVSDAPTEAIYLRDEGSHEVWSATPLPCGAADFTIRHGQGYTVFEHQRDGLAFELTLFVSPTEPMKWSRLKIRNLGTRPRRLSAFYYAEWVLGTNRDRTGPYVVTEIDADTGALLARNAFDADYASQVAFVHGSQPSRSVTGDRTEFVGRNGSLAAPAGCAKDKLSGKVGACLDPCAVLQATITIGARETEEIVFVMGETADINEARRLANLCRQPKQVQDAWEATLDFWNRVTGALTIRTPDPALDLLVNRWLPCQVLSCRMWGRSAFYQSGGAFGFRDQLQDSLALVYALPEETRRHILRAAGRQFVEGDVQHWWHPPRGAGVRTRFSDDYLWLPFAVHHYVQVTGDQAIMDESVPFLQAPALRPDQDEDYRVPEVAAESGTVFEHCVRAIQHGLRFGAHGLPLMGTGDWNDGMNRVGSEGRGESVWTGWFLFTVLRGFAELCDHRDDRDRATSFRARAEELRKNLEEHAWDGQWYRRAYFDDGRPLGSAENDECRIDSIAQSWAVISGAGDPQRTAQAMEAVNTQLVRRAEKLVLLFTPPFDKGSLQPGYIKGYVPGIRENGGQYTHAALWVAKAWALLGRGDRAVEVLDLLNPIHHTDSADEVARYRLEPYVVPADVYGEPPHTGRGGWSWYTGSASWYYRVVVETILGFQLRGDRLRLQPHLPEAWPSVEFRYRYRSSVYEIKIENAGKQPSPPSVTVDGRPWTAAEDIVLVDDGKTHTLQMRLA